jgi:beta-glucosidase
MSSYNEIDGMPTTGDPWLLTDVLRGQLGFDGYVASDFGAISGLGPSNHGVAANDSECVRQFLVAGGSVNGHDMGTNYETLVVALVTSGAMPEAILDRAAGDVMRVKARLGLIAGVGPGSPAIVDTRRVATHLGDNVSHVATALRAARESVVVVQNDGTLPLPATVTKVLIVGPNADAIRAGDYSAAGWAGGSPNGGGNINNANAVTVVQALKSLLPNAIVTWAPAANLVCAPAQQSDRLAVNSPLWSTVQSHSCLLAEPFSPTAPSIPFHNETPGTFPAGTRGLAATYYDGRNGTTILLTRVDAAPNFHWFNLGPDLFRARSGTFRVRWEGILVPDATVRSGGLRANADSSPRAGTRVWLDGDLVIDAWNGGNNVSAAVDWERGVGRHVAIEYWQETADTSPSFFLQWSMLSTSMTAQQSVDEAVELAKNSDAVIAVVGGANNDHAATTEGEGKDRASLLLGGTQSLLLMALRSAAIPSLVVVLMDGKPTADPALDGLPAVVAAFQGGQACGQAIAEIVLGMTEPSGRLPISFPLSAEMLPVYYSRRPSGRSLNSYCDVRPGTAVRWPFGHGLSYTSFAAYKLVVLTPIVPADGSIIVNATVINTGGRAGWVVPQLYLKRDVATVTTPALSLKGFARHYLQPGQSAVASFTVDVAAELAVWGRDLVVRAEPGNVTVYVGFSSADLPLTGSFRIV